MRRPPRTIAAVALSAGMLSWPAPAHALEAHVVQLRITAARLWTSLELRELLAGRFLALVREGRAIFLQVQAEVWEDRRVLDRLILGPPPAMYRIHRDAAGSGMVIADDAGGTITHPDARQPLSIRVDLGPADRIDDGRLYYVHARVRAATVDEREIDGAGEAIFGDRESARGLASLGRFVFRTLLQLGRDVETATSEVTSRRISGADIRRGAF